MSASGARRLWLLLLPNLLILGAFGYWIVSTSLSASPRPPEAVSVRTIAAPIAWKTQATSSPKRFARATGLEVLRVAVTGDGGILDLRYRVVDGKTAAAHKNHQAVPAIIDLGSGRALTTQWMGHAHPPDSFQPDRNYWMLFLNPGELVERGDRVAVRLGHARLTGVPVG